MEEKEQYSIADLIEEITGTTKDSITYDSDLRSLSNYNKKINSALGLPHTRYIQRNRKEQFVGIMKLMFSDNKFNKITSELEKARKKGRNPRLSADELNYFWDKIDKISDDHDPLTKKENDIHLAAEKEILRYKKAFKNPFDMMIELIDQYDDYEIRLELYDDLRERTRVSLQGFLDDYSEKEEQYQLRDYYYNRKQQCDQLMPTINKDLMKKCIPLILSGKDFSAKPTNEEQFIQLVLNDDELEYCRYLYQNDKFNMDEINDKQPAIQYLYHLMHYGDFDIKEEEEECLKTIDEIHKQVLPTIDENTFSEVIDAFYNKDK